MKLNLNAEQAEECVFPIGCPVWYNFPDSSIEKGETRLLKQGVVESISVNLGTKDVIYKVMHKDEAGGEQGTIVDEVSECKLAYAAGCPVTISTTNGDRLEEGTILVSQPSLSDPGNIIYTVMIFMEGSQARLEDIDAQRIKYRRVNLFDPEGAAKPETATGFARSPPAASFQQAQRSTEDNYLSKAKILACVSDDTDEVPSSIAWDSSSMDNKEGAGSSDKRNDTPDFATATSKKKLRMDTTAAKHVVASHGHHSARSGKSTGSHESGMEIKIPAWLQRTYHSQRQLFFHLIDSKHTNRLVNRTVKDIGQQSNCAIVVNYNSPGPRNCTGIPAAPITLTIRSRCRLPVLRDLDHAREMIIALLSDHMDAINDGGAKGKMMYEVASSCSGEHRPRDSTSRAVRVGGNFISLVELPFASEQRGYHAGYLLSRFILRVKEMKESRCILRICGDDYNVPLKSCNPHVIVTGRHWQDVDRVVEMVKDEIENHMRQCSCAL